MTQYRKKPVTIEAVQFDGLNPTEIKDFAGENCEVEIYDNDVTPPVAHIIIHTLEGDMEVSKGDYVIKGVKGEFYPCKPDIFERTYESEEPDKILGEAAEISFDEAKSLTEDYRDFLAKGLTENQPRPIGPHWFCEYAKKRFIAGAEWQKEQDTRDMVMSDNRHFNKVYELGKKDMKEQMLKEAVEGYVNYYEDSGGILMAEAQVGCPYHNGDKVHIVVLKAEEE